MSEEKKPVPEGMKRYSMLGIDIVGPEGLPDEMIAAILEGMVRAGAIEFDHKTNTLNPNPNMKDDKIRGISLGMDDGFNVGSATLMSDEQVKKDLGVNDLNDISGTTEEKIHKLRGNKRKR
jgi:hypothetical protein